MATGGIVAVSAGAAAGQTASVLYVARQSAACSDSGPGTSAQPYCTIRAAASTVAAGQTVEVASGTYPEAVTVSSSGTSVAPIVFTAAPGAAVTIQGSANGFAISGRNWVTVRGFVITATSGYGIAVSDSSHITLEDNHVSFAGQPVSGQTKYGIRLSNVSDSVVARNTTDHNTNAGIGLVSGSTRNVVTGNTSFSNAQGYQRAAAGIYLYAAPSNTVSANVIHHNEDSGINCYPGSNGCLISNNVSYANGDHGIDDYQAPGARIVANTVFKNVTAGINVEGNSTGATVANNISVDNGIASPRTRSDIRVESGSTSGTSMDYNVVYLTAPDTLLIWDSIGYTSLAKFQAATGQERHGIEADPKWVDSSTGDFHLTAGSPAIDSANAAVSGQPPADIAGLPRVDDPATVNTGAGAPTYTDRGAHEFQPGAPSDAPPVARLSITPTSGSVPLAVTADASASTDTDATAIASYEFDFGDGSGSTGPQPTAMATHTYSASGTFTVTVTVVDAAGLASTATAQISPGEVPADAAPAAALTVTPTTGVLNLAVTADASASTDGDATPIATYTFDFGDGSARVGPQTNARAPHTYTKAGMFTLTVTVTDTAGLASTASAGVSVTDNAPVASLKLTPSSGTAPADITVTAAATDTDATPVATYTFDFGDGSPRVGPQSTPTAVHRYASAGSYTVTVTVADTAGLSSTAERKIKIR